jgi:hypothetical protein
MLAFLLPLVPRLSCLPVSHPNPDLQVQRKEQHEDSDSELTDEDSEPTEEDEEEEEEEEEVVDDSGMIGTTVEEIMAHAQALARSKTKKAVVI